MAKKKICLAILVLALAAICTLGGFVGFGHNFSADGAATAAKDGIVVRAGVRDQAGFMNSGAPVYVSDGQDGNVQLPTFDGVNISQFLWKGVDRFEIKADKSQIQSDITQGTSWSYIIYVQHMHGKPKQNGEFVSPQTETGFQKELTTFASGDVTDINQISAIYYIDANEEDDDRVSYDFGWGIYRFIIEIANTTPVEKGAAEAQEVTQPEQFPSTFFYVAPEEITEAPEVERREIHSNTKLEGDYEFTITNYSEYVNADNIRWYVIGTTKDDKIILFHQSDLSNGVNDPQRPDYFNFPGKKVEFLRTSTQERAVGSRTFVLDTGKREAEWQVFCVVYNEVPNGDKIGDLKPLFNNELASRSDTFSTIKDINPFNVLWIIIACAVVLVIGLVVIIVVSVRKEKVW